MSLSEIEEATAPARWLLELGDAGIPLTQTGALARSVVRDAALRSPHWWNAELFGPPHREAELPVLEALHDGLRRTRLLRRRGRRLFSTPRGRALACDPPALMPVLAEDLLGADSLRAAIAAAVADGFRASDHPSWEDLAERSVTRVRQRGFRRRDGGPVTSHDLTWDVSDVVRYGEAYGLLTHRLDRATGELPRFELALTPAGRSLLGLPPAGEQTADVLLFDATLLNADGVSARVAVRAHQHLTALHEAIQAAFGWGDDHLYCFWLDNRFWSRDDTAKIVSPIHPDDPGPTAEIPVADLALSPGARIAYLFDFGDEWRVTLTLHELADPDGGPYPRVISRTDQAPPQYSDLDDE